MAIVEQSRHRAAVIDYTNHRGERKQRTILPSFIWFGESDFHPGTRWLLEALDVERGVTRTFAMRDIHSWWDAAGEVSP